MCGDVFWTNPTAGTVVKCPVAGCSGKPCVIASGQSSAAGIGATTTTNIDVIVGGAALRVGVGGRDG